MVTLILEGGGMRAGFVAGVLMALMDKGLVGFDRALAVSASVPSLAYFAAGQRREIETIWRSELNTAKLVCYKCIAAASLAFSARRPVLDIDYLVDEVFRKKYPLDIRKLQTSRTACVFAVTDVRKERLALLGPFDFDMYKIFKASLAVPGVYPETVRIRNYVYVDGGTVNPLPLFAINTKKPNRVFAILSKPVESKHEPITWFERSLFWRYFNKYEWMLEKQYESADAYNEQVSHLRELADEEPPRGFIVCPEKMPPAKLITRDRRKINRTIDLGYRQVEKLENQIRRFMERETAEA
jgi:predicted patatin/cPLA2 family phospholipase